MKTRNLGALLQDVRFGSRFLRRNPGFAAAGILTLAVATGVNTAIFSALYAILLKPLAFPEPSRLVEIRAGTSALNRPYTRYLSSPELDEIVAQSQSLARVARYLPAGFALTGRSEPESLRGLLVSGDWFTAYGIAPLLGRPVLPEDAAPGRDQVVVLSYNLWERSFGSDPGIVGTVIDLAVLPTYMFTSFAAQGKPYQIIGVMPVHARFPVDGDLWVPLRPGGYVPSMGMSPRTLHSFSAVARLTDQITLARANGELHQIAVAVATAHPDTDGGWDLRVVLLRDALVEDARASLILLFVAVNAVVALACVSVSGLTLARNRARARDVAIRGALGATRGRLARQFLVESVLLSLAGGSVGLALASWGVHLVRAWAPAGTPRLDEMGLQGSILAYTFAVCLIAGLIVGLLPAIQLTRPDLSTALKHPAGVSGRPLFARWWSLRDLFIGAQIALAFPLVVGSVLALRSLDRLAHVDLGYEPSHVLSMNVKLSPSTCATFDKCLRTFTDILARTRTVPGVEAAAVTGTRPFSVPIGVALTVEGTPGSRQDAASTPVQVQFVTPDYFHTMGIPMLRGRGFDAHDVKGAPWVAMINETLAHSAFGGRAIGQRFSAEGLRSHRLEVVAVVGDARDLDLTQTQRPTVYLPLAQSEVVWRPSLLVRTVGNPVAVAPRIWQQIRAIDRDAPITDLSPMDQVIADTTADRGFRTALLSLFAGLSLFLGLLGIHGLIAYAVSSRTQEFGVRVALGAQPNDLVRLVLGESVRSLGLGLVVGIGSALALTRYLTSLLFEIEPTDPATFVWVAVLMIAAALTAYYVPARRATKVDPLLVLRGE